MQDLMAASGLVVLNTGDQFTSEVLNALNVMRQYPEFCLELLIDYSTFGTVDFIDFAISALEN